MKRVRHVLHIAESPYFGGINAHIRSVAHAFSARSDFAVDVATLPGRSEERWLLDVMGDAVHEISMRGRFDPGAPAQLRRLVTARGYDIVHTHNYRSLLIATVARLDAPIVHTCHGMLVGASMKLLLYEAVTLRAMRRLRVITAVSNCVRDWLIERNVPAAKIRTVYNGYRPPDNPHICTRSDLGIPEDAIVFVFCGRLVDGKGAIAFVRALAGVPGAHAVIVGDGPARTACEVAARDARVPATFTGVQRDPAPYYALSDVVVLPSQMEALPMALIEAAAFGVPAVATHAGGIGEVVLDGETGILVRYVDELADALRSMLDAERRRRMGAAAQTRWRDWFTIERMAEGLADVYDAALADGR